MFYNERELARMRKSLEHVKACNGDCHNCKYLNIPVASSGRSTFYAFECSVDSNIQPMSNTTRELRQETIDALQFELA